MIVSRTQLRLVVAALGVAASGLPGVAGAETVYVKYRGPVDLAPFDCVFTESSLVGRVCYHRRAAYMIIQLSGVYYHYCGIDRGTVNAMLAAPSIGRYFAQNVRGNYDCRIIPPPA